MDSNTLVGTKFSPGDVVEFSNYPGTDIIEIGIVREPMSNNKYKIGNLFTKVNEDSKWFPTYGFCYVKQEDLSLVDELPVLDRTQNSRIRKERELWKEN